MIDVRLATEDDIQIVVDTGEEFHYESIYGTLVSYDPDSVINHVNITFECDLLFVAYDDDKMIGFLGAVCVPFWLNNKLLVASEQFFWVKDKYRKAGIGDDLIKLFVDTCEERGIRALSVCVQHNGEENMAGAIHLFKKNRFVPLEHTFMRIL